MTIASQVFLASIPLLIGLYTKKYEEADFAKAFPDYPDDFNLPVEEVFEFIIVGGGTSGLPVARRLSDAGFSVLVLEAGGTPPPLQAVPVSNRYTFMLPEINFVYPSVPQKNAGLQRGGILPATTGKALGGGSSHNVMLYERGHPEGYNEWAHITGDPSWRYENILKYFKRAENYVGQFKQNEMAHNAGGAITISQPKYSPGRDLWLQAGRELGYPSPRDMNGPQGIGFGPCEFSKKFGRRESTYTGYIKGIEETQEKLTIRRYSTVTKLIIEEKTAKGVIYTHHGVPKIALASKEVILSAGSFISPLLLVKSGIGPKDQLDLLNITEPVLINENVGRHLMEHVAVRSPTILVEDPTVSWRIDRNLTQKDFNEYIENGDGPVSSSYCIAEAYEASKRAKAERKPFWPDLQITFDFNQVDIVEVEEATPEVSVVCRSILGRPRSKGRLTINASSAGILDPIMPVIDFKFFEDETDFDVMMEGLELCHKIVTNTNAFRGIGAKVDTTLIEACKDKGSFRSREYYRCYIQYGASDGYHSCATAKMGKRGDPEAVVDSKFRVLGIQGLRVVDASVFPTIPNANTATPCVMIGEKAADDITNEYKDKQMN